MSAQTISEASAIANKACIRYPRFKQLSDDIRDCQEMSQIALEPQCMVLVGVTGAGKTTLVQAYAEESTRYDSPSGSKIHVLYVETPSPVTVKGMAAKMLEVLGDPAAHKGSLWSMNSRLIQYLKACEVQIVILDDFHHLVDVETNRVLEQVSDWLKVLIKESRIPFLIVGIEGKIESILDTNRQLSRLFAVRETLRPFNWNPNDPESIREFTALVLYAEQAIGRKIESELTREEVLYRIYCATDGVMANLMNLLRFAGILAEREGLEVLSFPILKQAYAKRLQNHMNATANPFDVTVGQRFVPPPKQVVDKIGATGHRSSRRKNSEPSVAEVLTTR